MALKVTNVPSRLAQTLVTDTDADVTTNVGSGNNVFTGVTLANKFYSVRIDNSAVNAVTWVKIQDATTYNTANDPAFRLYVPASSVSDYVIPAGLALSNGFSFIATSTSASTGTHVEPSDSCIVTVLGGT